MAKSRNRARTNGERLYHEQDGKCFYCDNPTFLRKDVTRKFFRKHRTEVATFDHIKIKAQGGTYAKANGVSACHHCNGMRGALDQQVFIEHFDFIKAEWEKGNRTPSFIDGELTCIPSKKFKRYKKTQQKNTKNLGVAGFIIARYAMQIGKTVEDLFLENVYNSTYELVRDL